MRIEENPTRPSLALLCRHRNLETKSGGDKFKMGGAFIPTFSNVSGNVDSFRPRLTFGGPLIRKRLNFLQSFEYRYSRIRAQSRAPLDDSTSGPLIRSASSISNQQQQPPEVCGRAFRRNVT